MQLVWGQGGSLSNCFKHQAALFASDAGAWSPTGKQLGGKVGRAKIRCNLSLELDSPGMEWCGVAVCLWSWGQRHTWPKSQSNWRKTQGRQSTAGLDTTSLHQVKLQVGEVCPSCERAAASPSLFQSPIRISLGHSYEKNKGKLRHHKATHTYIFLVLLN